MQKVVENFIRDGARRDFFDSASKKIFVLSFYLYLVCFIYETHLYLLKI